MHVPTGPGEDDVTLDQLAGGWLIHQLRRGHRYATDDVLVAWLSIRAMPRARRVLDLGSGVGSVGLLALLHLGRDARLVAVEVQAVSVALARRTVATNGLCDRVDVRHGDIRDPAVLAGVEPFDLVCANPPYLPPGRAVTSPHPQRASARVELHGDIFDYCLAAATNLAEGGRFCFCHSARDPRPQRAVAAAGLELLARRDVVFRAGDAPTIALFECSRTGGSAGLEGTRRPPLPAPLRVRDEHGAFTPEYMSIRREMSITLPVPHK